MLRPRRSARSRKRARLKELGTLPHLRLLCKIKGKKPTLKMEKFHLYVAVELKLKTLIKSKKEKKTFRCAPIIANSTRMRRGTLEP